MISMIKIQNIRKEFGDAKVLTGVYEEIKRGEIFAIIGPSGQGKTTLLRILNLLETPSSGTILFDTVPIQNGGTTEIRRKMGMVFQSPVAFRESVFENIALGLRYRGFSKDEITAKVKKKLDEIGLVGYEDRKATTLSGGEKQRVSLARIMITEPDLLILDEPTANLDPVSTEVIENLIRYYNQTYGTTVIMSTHDLIQGQRLADRVAVMMNGRFVQSGTIFDVFTRPCSKDVAKFIGIGNILSGSVTLNESGLSMIDIQGVKIHAIGEMPVGTRVTIAIRPEDITLHSGPDQKTSARNVIPGVIQSVRPFGIISLIDVKTGDITLSVQVTWQSIEELNLKPDIPVTLSFKAPAVHIMPDEASDACR